MAVSNKGIWSTPNSPLTFNSKKYQSFLVVWGRFHGADEISGVWLVAAIKVNNYKTLDNFMNRPRDLIKERLI
jgi:hypothetical protein